MSSLSRGRLGLVRPDNAPSPPPHHLFLSSLSSSAAYQLSPQLIIRSLPILPPHHIVQHILLALSLNTHTTITIHFHYSVRWRYVVRSLLSPRRLWLVLPPLPPPPHPSALSRLFPLQVKFPIFDTDIILDI